MASVAVRPEELDCDYFVIGAGACGCAFVDGLLREQPGARVVIVDRQAQPGGHWVVDYSFVALHQPSGHYGVESVRLDDGDEDHLSTRAELLAYFEKVMSTFLATGRVKFFPLCDCSVQAVATAVARAAGDAADVHGGGAGGLGARVSFQSLVSRDRTYDVIVRRKCIDTTYLNIQVPSMRPPPYKIEEGATVVPCNAVSTGVVGRRYTIIGAGKTAMDTIVFLQRKGVPAEDLTWVVSGDAWLINRAWTTARAYAAMIGLITKTMSRNRDLSDCMLELESSGYLFRVDPEVTPTKFRCATVDADELQLLRRVGKVVRQGRVVSVGRSAILFKSGASVATTPDTVHVDATANGLSKLPPKPVWSPGLITLQPGFMCQPIACAIMIATVESLSSKELVFGVDECEDDGRNRMLQPVPHPENTADLLASFAVTNRNVDAWMSNRKTAKTYLKSRVFPPSHWTRLERLKFLCSINSKVLSESKANMMHMHQKEFGTELYLAPLGPPGAKSPAAGAVALGALCSSCC